MSTLPPLPTPPSTSYVVTPSLPQTVVISDIDMSIGAMCRFMVKWVIAAIPAVIILWGLMFFVAFIIAVVFGGVIHGLLGAQPTHF